MQQSDQSTTEKSSPGDVVFETIDGCSRTAGWSAEMTEAMIGMDDEQTERMLRMLRSSFPEEVGEDPEPVIEGMRGFLQERRRREKDQQEEEAEEQQQQKQEEAMLWMDDEKTEDMLKRLRSSFPEEAIEGIRRFLRDRRRREKNQQEEMQAQH